MASSDLNIGATGPISSLPTTRAITPVTPVAPQAVQDPEKSPLQRSGLSVHELFATPDQIVVRSRTPAVALELGLEQARGSMVRNHPADALAALDEVWSGAKHTETGWYLRGGSLALLGLPGEAARVATEAVQNNPQSAANHFLNALALFTLGETGAAQQALEDAAAHSDPDALLMVQQALIEAKRGNTSAAEDTLRRVAARWPDHPALQYGRDTLKEVQRNLARDRQRTPAHVVQSPIVKSNVEPSPVDEPIVRTPATSRTPVALNALMGDEMSNVEGRAFTRDVVAESFNNLGSQLATGTKRQVLVEARLLVGALSAGGTLAQSMAPARAHAARAVVGAIVEALNSNVTADALGWEAESVDGQWQRADRRDSELRNASIDNGSALHQATRALLEAIRDGRLADADVQLKKARGSLGESTFALLRSLLRAADPEGGQSHTDAHGRAAQSAYENGTTAVRDGFSAHNLLAPLRLGLALLPEEELSATNYRIPSDSDATVTYAASAAAGAFGRVHSKAILPAGSAGSLVSGGGLVALGILAFSSAHPMVAIILTATGGWLALRKPARGTRL